MWIFFSLCSFKTCCKNKNKIYIYKFHPKVLLIIHGFLFYDPALRPKIVGNKLQPVSACVCIVVDVQYSLSLSRKIKKTREEKKVARIKATYKFFGINTSALAICSRVPIRIVLFKSWENKCVVHGMPTNIMHDCTRLTPSLPFSFALQSTKH